MSGMASRGWSSPIRLLQYTAFATTLDRFAMPPMLLAIAVDLDVPLSRAVQAAGAYFVAYGLMQPVWGLVSDRLGLVRTLRITLILSALTTAASALAGSVLALAVFRCLAGGFFGAAFPAALIYIGDTVPAPERQNQITRLMVGVALGTAMASTLAGLLAHVATWRLAFLITGGSALLLAGGLGRLAEPAVTRTHRTVVAPLVQAMRSRVTVLVLLLAFIEGAVLLGALTLLPPAVEATGVSSSVAGSVTAGYGVAVVVSARLVGRLSRDLHPSRLIGLGGAAALVGCIVMAVSQAPAVALLVALLLGLAWAAMHSSLQTWATEVLPGARATVVSLFAGSLFIGSAVAAVVVSGLAQDDRYREIFLLAAATSVPLALLAVWGRATWRRSEEEPA
ncbi:putative MFS family arabinose efflux permease [Micromonospora kangleipakensis]|uniref:Putative MFS family arabinose efflux permease n=1 Tax=Micromonospora kangleipakensis TaxID=1077942 RepID=A0A4Q8BBQ7_9ACTN|nr:MFS transporter [Micromonospora kangleipakensis]RZU74998.1 putative MFS family arabinose efflux permease [Micromonospora kangleipakensis]